MALRSFNEQELQILASKGYDISKYDGRPVEIPDAPTELPSAGGVAVRSAAASALPTLAGGAGFAGGMALGGALAPATGGLSLAIPLVMGMGGALGASKLAAKGQEALLPDSVKQTLAEDYQARPVASTLGGLATLPLGGFNPGKLGQIGAGLSGMGKIITRPAINLPLSIAEKQAALNMTAGGTIGAVQEGVMQPLEGREFDPASIVLNAAIGGTFIRPNAIGRKLGFRGIPERTVDDPDQLSRTIGQHVEPEPVHELRQPTVNFTETQMQAMRRSTGLKQSGEVESQKVNIKTGEEIAEKPKLVKSAKTSAKAIEKALAEDAPVLSRETDPDILNVLVKQGRLVEKPVEGEAPKLPDISSPLAEEVAGGLKGKGLSTSPSEQYVATLAQEVMAEQNIKVSLDGNLTAADGAPLKGTALLPNSVREVVLNPKLATLDTLPHEGLHYFRTELEGRARSGDAEAQRLLTKWDEVSAEGLADYNQRRNAAGLKPVDAHEFAVSENGLEFVKQQFNLNKEGGMQKWWNDTKALFREKYSKNATVEDLRRAINFRFVNEQTRGQFVGAAQRDQPTGEGLTPQDERSLRLGKMGEGRTPYPFSEKERMAGEQIIEQIADDDLMIDKASELPGYTDIPPGATLDNPYQRNQGADEGLARTDSSAKSFLPGLASALDKVEQKVSAPIAQAGRNWASRRDSYTGKMQVALSDLEKLNDKVVDSAMRKMRMVFRGEVEKPPSMSAEELQAVQILRDYYTWNVEERIANGQMIEGREAGKNPYYVPDTMNEQARYTLLETPNSPEARYLKKVWADYVMEESERKLKKDSERKLKREEVVNNINGYVDAMGSKDKNYTSINFGAARKAQGYGMPEVMRETSAKRALVSYGRRAANDMAFFKEIESNRPIAAALMIKDPDTGKLPALKEGDQTFHTTQEVKNMMSWITGGVNENSIRHPFITSASRLTNNLLLGAPTGLRDLAQVPVFNVPYMNKWSDLSNFAKGVLNFQKESRNALEYAARQPQIDKLAFNEISNSPNRLLSAIQKAATFARKGQGREALENLSRNISFSIGKEFARGNVLGAKAGHAPSKKFLERFGTLVEGDVTKMEGPALEHAMNQIAKNVVDATQGTYGPAGLPNFTSEGQLAPFLALTKWSVEKSNTIFKDVVKPFYAGENRIPLLTYTLGSVLTGAGIQQLNEALSGKKGSDPMLEEALAKGDAEAISLQIATLMQLGTYMGIVGDSMKIAADVYKGKTPRNPLSFPLYSSAINSADMIADAMGAIQEGEDPVDILYHLSLDLMSQNVQNARVVLNRVEGEETARKESFRDVRVFEELEGKKGTDIPKVNRYKGMEAKEFKREKDVGEAAKMLPDLVSKAKGEAESLEELRMKLQSLKQNNYQTFPKPKTQPEAFKKYYQFLVKTQGEQEAQKRLADYLRQNQVNKVKSQLVPAF